MVRLMIINNFNVAGVAALPTKYDPPPRMNPNTVESCQVTTQRLQPISRRYSKVRNLRGPLDHIQFAHGDTDNVSAQPACSIGGPTVKYVLC